MRAACRSTGSSVRDPDEDGLHFALIYKIVRVMRRITGLFEDFSRAYAFALGGARCKEVHRRFIHNRAGGDRRATETETYGKCLLDALRADMESPADDG